MSSETLNRAEYDFNKFQRYLIPSDALYVRYAMTKASHFANKKSRFYAHTVPIAFAVAAVVMAFFNVISYLLQSPLRVARNIVCFRPVEVLKDLIQDITNVARSLMYIPLGVAFIVAGFFLPKLIYSNFAPDFCNTLEERLVQQIEDGDKQIKRLQHEKDELEQGNSTYQAIIFKQQRELEDFRKGKRWYNPF